MNEQRLLDVCFCLFLLALCLSAFASPGVPQSARQAVSVEPNAVHFVIPEAPELNIVTHVFPPFQRKFEGQIKGPFVDIMRQVCAEAQVTCHIRMGAFKDIYQDAIRGDADIIFSFLVEGDQQRRDQFILSDSIALTSYCFFTTSTSNWQWSGDPKELEGRTIGVYGPSGTSIVAQRTIAGNPSTKLVIDESNLKVMQNLVVGKYGQNASVVINKDVGLDLLKTGNIYGPKPAGDIEATTFGFGFSKRSSNAHLAPRMFDALRTLQAQRKIQPILREYGLTPAGE